MGRFARTLVELIILTVCFDLRSAAIAQSDGATGPATKPSVATASSSSTAKVTIAVVTSAPATVPPPASLVSNAPQPIAVVPSSPAAVSGSAQAGVRTAALTIPAINHHEDTAEAERLLHESVDGAQDDPLNWSVHVFKSRHRIELYFKNHLLRTYHAVFGRSRWAGGKQWEGDSRTPEGSYLIIAKHRSARFRWFLRLNYPNGADQERFVALQAAHQIPAGMRQGGQVGIHGTDSPVLNLGDVNWTLGCISVDNNDISEMAALLPVGTLVVINP